MEITPEAIEIAKQETEAYLRSGSVKHAFVAPETPEALIERGMSAVQIFKLALLNPGVLGKF